MRRAGFLAVPFLVLGLLRRGPGHSSRRGAGEGGTREVAAPRRVDRREDAFGRSADQDVGRLSGAKGEGGRRPRHPRDLRPLRLDSRRRGPAREGRLHRRRSRPSVRQRSGRRRNGIGGEPRRRRQARSDPHARGDERAPERGARVGDQAAFGEREERDDRLLLGRRRELRLRGRTAALERGRRVLRHARLRTRPSPRSRRPSSGITAATTRASRPPSPRPKPR